jgi:hypothetical protein
MCEAMRQMPEIPGRQEMGTGESRQVACLDEAKHPRRTTNDTGPGLLMAVLARENLLRAMKRVRANGGAAGVDGRNDHPHADCWDATIGERTRAALTFPGAARPAFGFGNGLDANRDGIQITLG